MGLLLIPPPPRRQLLDEAQAAALGFITEEEYDAWLVASDTRTLWEWAIEERQYRGRRLEPSPNPACPLHQLLNPPYRLRPDVTPWTVGRKWTEYQLTRAGVELFEHTEPPPCTCPQPKAI